MRRTLAVTGALALLALAGCGGGSAGGGEPAAASSSSTSSSSAAPRTTKAPAPTTSTPAPAATPQELFLADMGAAGIVPQLSSGPDAINLATTMCVAYGSGRSFTQVMATLAGGSMSLQQMMDLDEAATKHYCPRFYVPRP